MKRWLLITSALLGLSAAVESADLPTIGGEHLYYLRSRGQHLRKISPEEVVEYCVAQKLGGRAFEDLYAQLFSMRIELAKLQKVDGLSEDDSRVKTLLKTYTAYNALLQAEAQKIQSGLVREGVIAAETLESLGRAQQQR